MPVLGSRIRTLLCAVIILATVVVGGLLTSTFLTLVLLPTLYRWFEPKEAENEL